MRVQRRKNIKYISESVISSGRLCENYVHGSTALTTNEMASLESKYLSARPELSRRVPIEFSHSLAQREILLRLVYESP